MPALCDVNLLLALVNSQHVHHNAALSWLNEVKPAEAVICRVAQLGLIRLLNNPAVMKESVLESRGCWELWHQLLNDNRFLFVSEEPKDLDNFFVDITSNVQFSPNVWNDAYLAAYSLAGGYTLVTFDRGFKRYQGLDCKILA